MPAVTAAGTSGGSAPHRRPHAPRAVLGQALRCPRHGGSRHGGRHQRRQRAASSAARHPCCAQARRFPRRGTVSAGGAVIVGAGCCSLLFVGFVVLCSTPPTRLPRPAHGSVVLAYACGAWAACCARSLLAVSASFFPEVSSCSMGAKRDCAVWEGPWGDVVPTVLASN